MADFIADKIGTPGTFVEVTGFLAKDVVVQNKSHAATLVWFGDSAPTDPSQGYLLMKMSEALVGSVLTKLWFNGPRVHVSETN